MEDVNRVMEKLNKANKLMEDLIDLAMEDAEITQDEKQMLFSINENLGKYAKLIIETISDGVVDNNEKIALGKLEKRIINDAKKIAEEDSTISDDEKNMLTQLVSTIESM